MLVSLYATHHHRFCQTGSPSSRTIVELHGHLYFIAIPQTNRMPCQYFHSIHILKLFRRFVDQYSTLQTNFDRLETYIIFGLDSNDFPIYTSGLYSSITLLAPP